MKNRLLFILTALTMLLLGPSDSLRGIFSPLFTGEFGLTVTELGMIVSASYLGNIVFLVFGGVILDRFGIRKCQVCFILLLALAEGILFASHNFMSLAIGFFMALGLSTLINTTINLYSDRFSDSMGLMYINILFFIQGIGGASSQFLLSKKADSPILWHTILFILIIMLVPIALMMTKVKGLEDRKDRNHVVAKGATRIEFLPLALITIALSSYLIAEHGIGNYLIFWGVNELGKDSGRMGNALALYSAGIMLGRLIFSPFINRIGENRFITISLVLSGILEYLLFAHEIISITFILGLCSSIVYPTIVAITRKYAPGEVASRATTFVIAISSICDIVFNMLFGSLTANLGLNQTMVYVSLFHFIAVAAMVPMLIINKNKAL